MNKEYILGLDVGGTKCAVSLGKRGKGAPEILEKIKFPTKKNAPREVLGEFMCAIDRALASRELTYGDIHTIGISCGGPLDSKRGIIMSPPNLPGWDDIKVCEFFESRTGIKTVLENDANACGLAEWKYGAGRGCESMVFLTFGTGLGAGIVLNGELYSGYSGNAGEIGHVRLEKDGPEGYGKIGSCEGFCSGGGLAQLGVSAMREAGEYSLLYKACGGDEKSITAKLIADLAEEGDEICLGIYQKCGEQLGRTLAVLSDILDIQRIVIGGIYMRSAKLLRDKMLEVYHSEALCPCEVVAAGLGENVGDYAALSVADPSDASEDATEALFKRYPKLTSVKDEVALARKLLIDTYENGGKLLLCGNGGSAADCEHIAGELLKSFKRRRPISRELADGLSKFGPDGEHIAGRLEGALEAISLCGHPALSTAYANDVDPYMVFAQQVNGLGREGDLLIALTTSGNSKNCVYAAMTAKAKGMKVISITGEGGGRIASVSDVALKLPERETYLVQELTLPIYHYLCAELEDHFFG